ncbi:unnamed protein product [Ectocarpus sp. 4 AP-2014]
MRHIFFPVCLPMYQRLLDRGFCVAMPPKLLTIPGNSSSELDYNTPWNSHTKTLGSTNLYTLSVEPSTSLYPNCTPPRPQESCSMILTRRLFSRRHGQCSRNKHKPWFMGVTVGGMNLRSTHTGAAKA